MQTTIIHSLFGNKDRRQQVTIGLALVALIIVFSSISPYFFSRDNLLTILLTATSVGLIAAGQFLCLVTRNFDMSVGNVAAMGGVVFTMLIKNLNFSVPMALTTTLAMGLASGLIVGFSVAVLKTNSFITTFAMMQIFRGILFVLTTGQPITMPAMPEYRFVGTYRLFGVVQLPILLMVLVFIGVFFILKYTKLGRSVYAVGSNPEAAHICGINVAKVQIFCFSVVAVLAALAGALFASRVNAAQPNVGAMYAMDSIAASVVGGTAMSGGKGNIWGVFLGVMIVNVVQNGLIMVGLDMYYQYIVTGLILFFAVLAQSERKGKK